MAARPAPAGTVGARGSPENPVAPRYISRGHHTAGGEPAGLLVARVYFELGALAYAKPMHASEGGVGR